MKRNRSRNNPADFSNPGEAQFSKIGGERQRSNPMKAPKTVTVIPAMTRQDWKDLPPEVRRFIPWNRARQPVKIVKQTTKNKRYATRAAAAVEYFTRTA